MADSSQQEIVCPEKHPGLQISEVSTVFKKLAQNQPLPEVLDTLCLTIEKLRDEILCSILLVDKKSGRLSHGAAPSLPDFFRKAVNGTPVRMGMGSCGEAAFTAKRVIVEDILIHPNWKNFTSIAVDKAGLRACWSEPVIGSDSKVLGTFAIYYRQPKSPAREDLELIRGAAHIASIAIEYAMNQEQLKQANAELEQRVIERTVELRDVNEQLQVDIIKRKQTEDALRKSHDRLDGVLASLNDAILMVDPVTRLIIGHNDATTRIFGYSHEDLINKDSAFLHVDQAHYEQFGREAMAAYADPGYYVKEFEMRRKDGCVFPTEHFVRPVSAPNGSIMYVVSVVRDITERKRAEEALQDSRNMLRTVLDSIPSAVFWKDRDSVYLGGSRTWLKAAGLKSLEEVVGKSDYDLPWKREQADSFREDDSRVMESGIPEYGIIERYLRADGTPAWAKTNKVPLRDAEGTVTGVLGTYEDITERKQAEDALKDNLIKYQTLFESLPIGIT
jgi:PAS domain S-box-containing protein